MTFPGTITSAHNQRVKDAVRLRDRRQRTRQGRTAIDGSREILRAIEGGVNLIELFVCPELCTSAESRRVLDTLDSLAPSRWQVTPEVFDKLAFGQRREGVFAVAETPERTIDRLHVEPGALVAVLVGVEKPGNVGAALRSADAAGVSAVIVAEPGTDLFNPNCIRASLGTVFTRQVCQTTTADAIEWLRQRGSRIFAARPDAERLYTQADYRGEVALVLGSEAHGLKEAWETPGTMSIRVPMRGTVDSLNVSATAAVLFYEALRQRQG
jgi:RNA methyltransferase, TrmH family